MNKKVIKIFSCAWHLSHQKSLTSILSDKYEYQFYYLTNWVRKGWNEQGEDARQKDVREKPDNVHFVTYFDRDEYDLAILHVDQQCVDPSFGKSYLFNMMSRLTVGMPRIVINHGTPHWAEMMEKAEIIEKMKMMIGDIPMVVNSYASVDDWGWGIPIHHYIDPDDWFDLPKLPRVCTYIPPSGWDNYYNRNLLIKVREILKEKGIPHLWFQADYRPLNFDDFRQKLGESLIYFNPTTHAPMPRSRTEAMLSGCCIVTTGNHDAADFIKDGENGYIVRNNPYEVADLIDRLINKEYKKTVEIGQRGKETAKEIFNIERYSKQWEELIEETINNYQAK